MTEFVIGLALGIVIGVVIASLYTLSIVRKKKLRFGKGAAALALAALLVGGFAFFGSPALGGVAPAYAQSATPVPLNIPINVIFTETNTWLNTFAPIAAIGIGISIALAVLGYLGKMIRGAFN